MTRVIYFGGRYPIEVERLRATLANGRPTRRGKLECPLCPLRKLNKLKQLKTRVAKYHIEKRSYVCSGTKQMKVVSALYDYTQARMGREEKLPSGQCFHYRTERRAANG